MLYSSIIWYCCLLLNFVNYWNLTFIIYVNFEHNSCCISNVCSVIRLHVAHTAILFTSWFYYINKIKDYFFPILLGIHCFVNLLWHQGRWTHHLEFQRYEAMSVSDYVALLGWRYNFYNNYLGISYHFYFWNRPTLRSLQKIYWLDSGWKWSILVKEKLKEIN